MKPPRLRYGDHIRVVAPSLSMSLVSRDLVDAACKNFEQMGFTVSLGSHVFEIDQFQSSSIASRVADIHQAFLDPSVHGIIAALGGYNSNQLLNYLDFDLIAHHPKFFCGYSDITILLNVIAQRCGFTTYYGPNFLTFGQKNLDPYACEYFLNIAMHDEPFVIEPAAYWSNDIWYADPDNRHLVPNDGYWVLQSGHAIGVGVGGHLGTTCLLQGTQFQPKLKGAILLIEEDSDPANPREFDRRLQSILQQHDADTLQGILIGRFEKTYNMSRSMLEEIMQRKNISVHVPIIANVDFGHTEPHCVLPIGGMIHMSADVAKAAISVL